MSTAEPAPGIRELELGAESSIGELPFPLTIGPDEYFLSRDKEGAYRLLSAVCPHSWGQIVRWDNCFMCPDHGWRFELKEGMCVNGPRSRMYNFPVTVRNGQLYAEVPEDKTKWGTDNPH